MTVNFITMRMPYLGIISLPPGKQAFPMGCCGSGLCLSYLNNVPLNPWQTKYMAFHLGGYEDEELEAEKVDLSFVCTVHVCTLIFFRIT